MSYEVWPESIPGRFLLDGLSLEEPDLTIRDDTDAGPAKVRLRYTAASIPMAGKLILTTAQLATFRAFHRSTLRRGTLPFVWADPVDGSDGVFRFLPSGGTAFQVAALDGHWSVSFQVEKLPV